MVEATRGQARPVWRGLYRLGRVWQGRHGKSGIGEIRSGEAGEAWLGVARRGVVRIGQAGKEWRGAAEHGMVWRSEVRTGKAGI